MATVKKVRRAKDGDDTLRGCKIDKQGRSSCGPGQKDGNPLSALGRAKGLSKREERELIEFEKEQRGQRIRSAAKKLTPISTAPGVRPGERSGEYKKGSQSFFGGDRDVNEAKYGKKVAKKAAPKKAKIGSKVVKSKKK